MKKMTPEDLLLTLTEREKDVLQLVCQHKRYQEIAETFFISEGTVRTHMFNIYASLELKHLDRDERVLKIHNIYCPLIQKQSNEQKEEPEIEIIDVSPEAEPKSQEGKEIIVIYPEPDPISPEEEEIIDGDEMALITYTPESKNGGEKKMKPKKKRGCGKFIITLILGALMVIGAWYSWENYLKDMPIVQTIVQLINPDAVIDSSSSAPSSSSSSNSSSSDSESLIEKILPKTDPYADAYNLGDWAKQNDVWVRISEYEVTGTMVALYIEVWNKTGHEYFFSWNADDNFSMVDNKNNKYDVLGSYARKVNLDSDERLRILGPNPGTVQFNNDSLYKPGVTDLYVEFEYFATIDKEVFHIDLNN